METFTNKIEELIQDGWGVNRDRYPYWENRVSEFLRSAISDDAAEKFISLSGDAKYLYWNEYRDKQIGHLEGMALKIESKGLAEESEKPHKAIAQSYKIQTTRKVFVVHGHDSETKITTARFIEKLGLEPIILHEQPNSGRTIIEKFEVFSDVGFAVVLLTPDDVGAPSNNREGLTPRARQNVILELGYFMGKLGRERVCALYKQGVEIPSDYQGVLYTEIDAAGGWKTKLAQELLEVGFSIDLSALLQA